MTDQVKITGLPSGIALDGTELLPMVQGGVTVKEPASAIGTFVGIVAVSTSGTPAGGTSNIAGRDAAGNSAFNNVILNVDFRNALGTDINLTKNSGYVQEFNSGSVNTNLIMPDATTLVPLWSYKVTNESTATISVKTNVGGAICSLPPGGNIIVKALTTASAGGSWEFTPYANILPTADNQILLSKSSGLNVWSSNTISLNGNLIFGNSFTTSGNFAVTQTYTGSTNVTFPTSGTLATTTQIPSGAALTKTDDTNVTLTLGGSPTTALINSASITAGWTGQLAVGRGGTGTGTSFTQGSIVFSGASGVYSQDNANLFWDGTNHKLGVGTNSLASTDLATFSSTNANNIVASGTKTSVDGSSNQSAVQISATFNPTSGSSISSGFAFAGTSKAPSAQTISQVNGFSASPKFNANVGTITSGVGYYYDGGSSATGTVTNNYGGYFAAPVAGTIKIATYADNLCVGTANTTTNPPANGALIQGSIINSALTAFNVVGADTNKTLSSIANGASGTLMKSNGASALPGFTTATYPNTVTAQRLIYASATNAISDLATTASAVVTSDGSGNIGWTAQSSLTGVGGVQLIQTKTANNGDSSVTFTTGLTGYSVIKVWYFNVAALTNNVFLQMQVSTDGGSTYLSTGYLSGTDVFAYNSTTHTNTNVTSAFEITGGLSNTAGDTATGEIIMSGMAAAPALVRGVGAILNTSTAYNSSCTGSIVQSPNAIKFLMSSGNFRGGTFILQGIA